MTPTCQPALMTGPYDWDPAVIPLAEYQARLARVRALVAEDLLVGGDRAAFGALAWLTGFTPKLGPALALFPAAGAPRLWFSGGPGMVGSARRLTWIEDVGAFGSPVRDLAGLAGKPVALWGEAAVSAALHDGIAAVAGAVRSADAALDGLRQDHSPTEHALFDRAAAIRSAVGSRLVSDLGAGEVPAIALIAAERLGYSLGAQDVRILVSRRPGGPPLPIDDRLATPVSLPATILVAVRHGLLWSEGQFQISRD